MKEEQRNTLVHAINHFGVEGQINKAVEEMGELITELSRRNLSRYDKDRVAEEVADALIMLEQLRIIFGASKVDGYISGKLERLEKTINGDWRRQERMMPKGMVVHRSESLACYEIGKAAVAGFEAGLNEVDPEVVEKVKKELGVVSPSMHLHEAVNSALAKAVEELSDKPKTATEIVKEGERRRFELLHRGEVVKPRPCCLFCKHIRATVNDPYCAITGQEIIGEPRATCCGRFEPMTEKKGGNNE